MRVRRLVVLSLLTALAGAATIPAEAGERIQLAQTSMGAPDPSNSSTPTPRETSPRMDSRLGPAPSPQPAPAPDAPAAASIQWGAIGFTADGSYSSIWKQPSKAEAEAAAAKGCARFGRGGCEVASFSGQQCGALATYIGSHSRRRWKLSYTSGGETYPDAQRAAMQRCNADERTRGKCQLRTVVCADGR